MALFSAHLFLIMLGLRGNVVFEIWTHRLTLRNPIIEDFFGLPSIFYPYREARSGYDYWRNST